MTQTKTQTQTQKTQSKVQSSDGQDRATSSGVISVHGFLSVRPGRTPSYQIVCGGLSADDASTTLIMIPIK